MWSTAAEEGMLEVNVVARFGAVFVIKSRALWRIWGRFAAEILSARLFFPMGKEVILPCSR